MSKLPKRELPVKKKWSQSLLAIATVITGVVAAIAAFSGNVLSIRDNFSKLFGGSSAGLSFSLQEKGDVDGVVFSVSNKGPKAAIMLSAQLALFNSESVWVVPLEFDREDATFPGESMKVVRFKLPDNIGYSLRITKLETEKEESGCFLEASMAGMNGSTQQKTEILCSDLIYLTMGLNDKLDEANRAH